MKNLKVNIGSNATQEITVCNIPKTLGDCQESLVSLHVLFFSVADCLPPIYSQSNSFLVHQLTNFDSLCSQITVMSSLETLEWNWNNLFDLFWTIQSTSYTIKIHESSNRRNENGRINPLPRSDHGKTRNCVRVDYAQALPRLWSHINQYQGRSALHEWLMATRSSLPIQDWLDVAWNRKLTGKERLATLIVTPFTLLIVASGSGGERNKERRLIWFTPCRTPSSSHIYITVLSLLSFRLFHGHGRLPTLVATLFLASSPLFSSQQTPCPSLSAL